MHFLGIDGGGTKTDFKVVNEEGAEVLKLRVAEGSKPGYRGTGHSVAVLRRGLDLVIRQTGRPDAIYAGIAGCATSNSSRRPIRALLAEYADTYELGGDLLTSYRSASARPYGIVFLCGSGSGIAHWYPNGFVNLDSLCYGSRDILFLLAHAYKQSQFTNETEQLLQEKISREALDGDAYYFLTHKVRTQALKELNQQVVPAPVWQDLCQVLDMVIARWTFKGLARILWHQNNTDIRPTDVVLVGGVWNLDYIRKSVVANIQEVLGREVNMIFEPHKSPVDGAAKLAQELVLETKLKVHTPRRARGLF